MLWGAKVVKEANLCNWMNSQTCVRRDGCGNIGLFALNWYFKIKWNEYMYVQRKELQVMFPKYSYFVLLITIYLACNIFLFDISLCYIMIYLYLILSLGKIGFWLNEQKQHNWIFGSTLHLKSHVKEKGEAVYFNNIHHVC